MDGFTGFKSAAAEESPDAKAIMAPFHIVHLAGNALDECRRRIQQELHYRRGLSTPPVQGPQDTCTPGHAYSHSVSNTRYSTCLPARSASHSRPPGAPTKISPDAYRSPNTYAGKALIQAEINTLTSTRVPRCLTELITLGKTFKRRATDILANFGPSSNGPTEAINGHLKHLRGYAPRTSETSPTTSPEHSSKPADSNTQQHPNYEEPKLTTKNITALHFLLHF